MPKKYRGSLEIISEILLFIKTKGKAKKTEFLRKANLGSRQANLYLDDLLKWKLIENLTPGEKEGLNFRLTAKGEDLLKTLQEIKKIIGEMWIH